MRRREEREHAAQVEADRIRESVHGDSKAESADMWVIHGITFRKLTAAGLDRFATDDERSGASRMDAIDRERERNVRRGAQTENVPPAAQFGNVFRRVPYTGVNRRRREIMAALESIG